MRQLRRRGRLAIGSVAALAVATALVGAPGYQASAQWGWWPPPTASSGAKVVAETRVDQRTVDVKISSPALGEDAMVRLLVPPGWSKTATRTWPVLYLLHGCCEEKDYLSWTNFTDVEEFTADKDVIVVMPTGGKIGMYAQWWNYGMSSKPDWPTFHVTELREILERDYKAGTKRSVAGLSMGAYGAMEYATRFPGTFGAAAGYSGAINLQADPIPLVTQLNMVNQGYPIWGILFGDPYSQRARWADHNPYTKVDKLRGTHLFVSAGDGKPGPLDNPDAPEPVGELLESVAQANSKTFTDKLRAGGIPVTVDYYQGGTHTWPYWERALKRSWPVLAAGMGIAP